MSDENRRCGTCDYWGHVDCMQIGNRLRGCAREESEHYMTVTRHEDGTNCPCWARKESDDGE